MFIVWLLSLCVIVESTNTSEPIVHTNFGAVRGKWLKSARNLSIAGYLGIPYAQQPTGPLRFKNPQAWTEHWDNVLDASKDGPSCPQLGKHEEIIGSELCLNLNIFVPLIKNKQKLAVLVFIHGGDFSSGSNNSTEYSPNYLLDHEIILVTVNYRLGILGFLSTGNMASPGNYGIKDVFEALKWIQANIGHFGGDPTLVTLSGGASAGAAVTHYLALSKTTEGFFDKIITHSGSATALPHINNLQISRIKFIKLAIQMKCTTDEKLIDYQYTLNQKSNYQDNYKDDELIIECLRNASSSDITEKLEYFKIIQGKYSLFNFAPTIELESEGAIITKHPEIIIKNGEYRDIPWISGITLDEGLVYTMSLFMNNELLVDFKNDLEETLPSMLEMQEIVMNNSNYADQLMDFYFPNGFHVNENMSEANLTAMFGDGLITYWCYSSFDQQARKMNSSVYFYQFSYEGTFSETFNFDLSRYYGVAHGDDINYLFPKLNNQFDDLQYDNTLNDTTMINIMTELWSSFVKTGIPQAIFTPEWESYQENFQYMRLGVGESPDISMKDNFLTRRMDFWQNLMGNISAPRDNESMNDEKSQTASSYSQFTLFYCIFSIIISRFVKVA